jgi:two-component system chemotaxis response regulator CheB
MYSILLVEDDPSVKFAYRKILTKKGYTVSYASNGAEGLELAKNNDYDIIISDWLMPVMDGIELISKVRSEIKNQPIIFLLTAVNSSDARSKALFAGADEYLTKPIDFNLLVEKIEESLKKDSLIVTKHSTNEAQIVANKNFFCVGVAASTGGPSTLVKFFSSLGVVNEAAFLIVLHGPIWMLESFVTSLQDVTEMKVHQGATGIEILPGNIYLSPGNIHMVLSEGTNYLKLIDSPPENFVKPSADPLFKSIAASFGDKSIGMVFTGMGKDGAYGTGYINAAGGKIIVQDPKTAILSSMPEAVIKIKMADEVVPLDTISDSLKNYLR